MGRLQRWWLGHLRLSRLIVVAGPRQFRKKLQPRLEESGPVSQGQAKSLDFTVRTPSGSKSLATMLVTPS